MISLFSLLFSRFCLFSNYTNTAATTTTVTSFHLNYHVHPLPFQLARDVGESVIFRNKQEALGAHTQSSSNALVHPGSGSERRLCITPQPIETNTGAGEAILLSV